MDTQQEQSTKLAVAHLATQLLTGLMCREARGFMEKTDPGLAVRLAIRVLEEVESQINGIGRNR